MPAPELPLRVVGNSWKQDRQIGLVQMILLLYACAYGECMTADEYLCGVVDIDTPVLG